MLSFIDNLFTFIACVMTVVLSMFRYRDMLIKKIKKIEELREDKEISSDDLEKQIEELNDKSLENGGWLFFLSLGCLIPILFIIWRAAT